MRTAAAVVVLLAVVCLGALVVWMLNVRGEDAVAPTEDRTFGEAEVHRGAYLARLGNCAGCHTARGGAEYAGGRGIDTPFGTVYAPNLTPDAEHGIGTWTSSHFWRAMHNGRSKDGRLLYPAFPYTEYTTVTREDSDAIYAFLRTQRPVPQANRRHALRFPYQTQAAIAVWRALYFTPAAFAPDTTRSPDWNRGAYLVRGLGHCNACHGGRNLLGASVDEALGGGLIPAQNWYAPALTSPREAGVAAWPIEEIVRLLSTGVASSASVTGPMAEVVFRSTQHATADDLRAIATFLKALPQSDANAARPTPMADDDPVMQQGAKVYERHCAECHGDRGEGAIGAYPPLAGNRAVMLASPANVVRVIVAGGFPPSTAGNPRPYGMPPFVHALNDADVARVATYVRNAWGNAASPVLERDVARYR